MKKPKSVRAWIFVSDAGHPAPYFGWERTRKALVARWREYAGGSGAEAMGYRAVRVTMVVER